MGGLDLSVLGLLLAVLTGGVSFYLGRRWRARRQDKRRAKERAAEYASQSRQVRRARERRNLKG